MAMAAFSYAAGTNADGAPLGFLGSLLMAFLARDGPETWAWPALSRRGERTARGSEPSALVKFSCEPNSL